MGVCASKSGVERESAGERVRALCLRPVLLLSVDVECVCCF